MKPNETTTVAEAETTATASVASLRQTVKTSDPVSYARALDRERAHMADTVQALGSDIGSLRDKLNKAVSERFDRQREIQRLDDQIAAMQRDLDGMIRLRNQRRRNLLDIEIETQWG